MTSDRQNRSAVFQKVREAAAASYSLINRGFSKHERSQCGEAVIPPKTAPKREFRPEIGLKSLFM
jgi:hypothetical protein